MPGAHRRRNQCRRKTGVPPSVALGRFEWTIRPWPTVAAAIGIALAVALGSWQLGRAQYKEALHQRLLDLGREPPTALAAQALHAKELELRRVEVRGRFERRFAIFLDNRVHHGQAGYHVLMPLRIAGSTKYVLVNRGWIAAGSDRSRAPAVSTPDAEVVVRGIAHAPGERYVELSGRVVEGNIWQNFALERYRASTGLDLHPIVLQQESDADDGLVREWVPAGSGRDVHLAYAFQWFSLGVAILVFYVAFNVRRKSSTTGPH
jgi:surfeit locus 1 family protein